MTDNYILRRGERYRRIAPGDWYESQIQALTLDNSIALFPAYECVRLEPYFRTPAGDVQPDLVLVRRDLSGWGLVEVELDTHSFTSHVLPQVSKLARARGDSYLAAALQERIAVLREASRESIETLLSREPKVYLVTHASSLRARDRLNQLGVHQLDVEILRNLDAPNDALLLVEDHTVDLRELPERAVRSTSPLTRRAWTLHLADPDTLPWVSSHVSVASEGTETIWRATRTSDGLILMEPASAAGLEAKVRMRVRVDDVNQIIHLADEETS
jgi:hypothetical protein